MLYVVWLDMASISMIFHGSVGKFFDGEAILN